MPKIEKTGSAFTKEQGVLGFAGGKMTSFSQKAVALQDDQGNVGAAIGTFNPLWCDGNSYRKLQNRYGPERGEDLANWCMSQTTDFALQMALGLNSSPMQMLDEILTDAHDHHQRIMHESGLPLTSTLNALVPFDIANYVLDAMRSGHANFYEMIPDEYKQWFSHTVDRVAVIPLVSYGIEKEGIEALINDGYRIFKTKMGSYDNRYEFGSEEDMREMVRKDCEKASLVYDLIKNLKTDLTENGEVPMYLDFNGRLGAGDKAVQRLDEYIRFAKQKGFFERVIVWEEPFADMKRVSKDVYSELRKAGVRVVADECAHTAKDVKDLLELGVRGFALKPAAKTYSETIRMINVIEEYNGTAAGDEQAYYFCADLTVVPWLVDANLQFTARSAPWPGLTKGVRMLESNWKQHYPDSYSVMQRYTPSLAVMQEKNGVFTLDEQWYQGGGSLLHAHGPLVDMAKANMRLT